jgi:hypothetical protein
MPVALQQMKFCVVGFLDERSCCERTCNRWRAGKVCACVTPGRSPPKCICQRCNCVIIRGQRCNARICPAAAARCPGVATQLAPRCHARACFQAPPSTNCCSATFRSVAIAYSEEETSCRSPCTSIRANAPAACSVKWPARTRIPGFQPVAVIDQGFRLSPRRPQGSLHLHAVRRSLVSQRLPGRGDQDRQATTGAKVVLDAVCVGCKVCTIACPFGTINYSRNRQGPEVRPLWRRPGLRDGLPDRRHHLYRCDWTGLERMRKWAQKTDSAARL